MPVQNSNFKTCACPDLASQLLLLSPYQLHLIACCVKKGNLHISHVIEDGLLETYLVDTLKKSKLKILHRNFCVSKKQVFRKLPVQKTGRMGPG